MFRILANQPLKTSKKIIFYIVNIPFITCILIENLLSLYYNKRLNKNTYQL